MCMVGALNVGSIHLNCEPEFSTNFQKQTDEAISLLKF